MHQTQPSGRRLRLLLFGCFIGFLFVCMFVCWFSQRLSRKHNAGCPPAAADGASPLHEPGEGGKEAAAGETQAPAPQDKEAPRESLAGQAALAGLGGEARRRRAPCSQGQRGRVALPPGPRARKGSWW